METKTTGIANAPTRTELETVAARWWPGENVATLDDKTLATYLEHFLLCHLEYWRGDDAAWRDLKTVTVRP